MPPPHGAAKGTAITATAEAQPIGTAVGIIVQYAAVLSHQEKYG
jgi:hypothetical protein